MAPTVTSESKLSDDALIDVLRREVAAWFSNVHLLEFEELLRRFNAAKAAKEKTHE
jgi:hypothetical protein